MNKNTNPFSTQSVKTWTQRPVIVSLIAIMLLLVTAIGAYGLTVRMQLAQADTSDGTSVTTYKEDAGRSGHHASERILNTSNVKQSTFGKRVAYPVDGQVYAQPLFLPKISIAGNNHNVVFVATEHDSVYAFDADQTSAVAPLWHTSFINPPTVVSPSNTDVACNDTIPENGLTGTPVIDSKAGVLYVLVMTKEGSSFIYRLHALDITTGKDKPGSPVVIQASVPGKGAGNVNGQIAFQAQTERQRAGLLMANGKVYMAFGSFCDNDPYHGWILSYSYNGATFKQENVYNDTANATRGGIWGAGGAISTDINGNIYYVSGNGTFDLASGGVDTGDSFVKLSPQLQILDYFTPFNQQCLDAQDADLGSGGPLLLPGQNRFISAGKEGRIYVIDTTNMGHFTADPNMKCNTPEENRTDIDKIPQELPPSTIGGFFSNATLWTNAGGQQFVYFAGANDSAKMFPLANGKLATAPTSHTPENFGFTGGNPTISSNNGANGTGILWTLDPTPALRAFDATNLSHELYNTTQIPGRDGLDSYVKFSTPTVANGEVFVGTKTKLMIYGLNPATPPTPTPTVTTTPSPNGYNNIGISDDTSPASANYDIGGNSYSTQALRAAGLNAGDNAFDPTRTVVFTWPAVPPGIADNFRANGQVIPITAPAPNAKILAFLGSSTNGPSSGAATITYTDGTTQTFTLGFSDWTLNAGKSQPAFGNTISYTSTYRNTPKGKETVNTYVFYVSVNLQAGKTVKSVTLPSSVNQGQLHVFAITTK